MRAETGEPGGSLTLTFGAAPRRSQQWPEMDISQDEGFLIIACDTLDSLVYSSCQKAFANYLEDPAIQPPTRLRAEIPLSLSSADESGSRCGALELPLVVARFKRVLLIAQGHSPSISNAEHLPIFAHLRLTARIGQDLYRIKAVAIPLTWPEPPTPQGENDVSYARCLSVYFPGGKID